MISLRGGASVSHWTQSFVAASSHFGYIRKQIPPWHQACMTPCTSCLKTCLLRPSGNTTTRFQLAISLVQHSTESGATVQPVFQPGQHTIPVISNCGTAIQYNTRIHSFFPNCIAQSRIEISTTLGSTAGRYARKLPNS
jgi:hypothetical protein